MDKKYYLSASLVCADMLHLEDQVKQIEEWWIDYIHIDVMDGHFVPRFWIFPEIVKQVRSITNLPMDVHMMTDVPEPYIPALVDAWVQIIAVHVECNQNLHRTIKMIKDSWIMAWVVLNMATPLNILDYIMDDIWFIMLMWINPGIVWHKIIPKVYDKIRDLKEKTKDYPNMIIEVDGGVTPESLPKMIQCWANMFVCWSSTIFRPADQVKEKSIELRQTIEQSLWQY